jgi:hypothetical protein
MSIPRSPTCKYPGAAYAFTSTAEGWTQTAKLTAPDLATTDPARVAGAGDAPSFGSSVSISADTLAIGAPAADHLPGDDAGAVYHFQQATEGLP